MNEATKEKIIIAVSVVGVGAALAVAILLLQERADTRTAPPGSTPLPGADPIMRTSLDDAATGNASRTNKPAPGSKANVGSSRSAPTPAPQTRQAQAARVDPERPSGGGGSWLDTLLNLGSSSGKNNDTTEGLWS